MKKFLVPFLFIGVLLSGVMYLLPADVSEEQVQFISEPGVEYAKNVTWPVPGSAPVENVQHTVPLDEIKQGCARQDCIPAVDDPVFVPPADLVAVLSPESIGIALSYKGVNRFYPFPMLETKELVNDTVAGDPILISYCPLCGTGIVFKRELDGVAAQFGVSGMLWQSNLLMYNRADALEERNLWSQVLGQAVVGSRAGEELEVIPSDIMQFTTWADAFPGGEVLVTGAPQDPYRGQYYNVARNFAPDFTPENLLPPESYVYGIEVGGTYKAYPRTTLPTGSFQDIIEGIPVIVTNIDGVVQFSSEDGGIIADVEGFWFSWKAAHPETLIWNE